MKQFNEDDRFGFSIIAFKNKFILYQKYSYVAYFLNEDFYVQSIMKFKTSIVNIRAINSNEPDILEYIDEENSKFPINLGQNEN